MLTVPAGYEPLNETSLRQWLAGQSALATRLGGAADTWQIREVSDGNLNVVFIVTGPSGGVCVKQSLPYVRVAGEGWPMPLERAYFEQLYLRASEPHVRGLAPALLYYDPARFAFAMELLAEHMTLRNGLIAGHRYPNAARRVGEYVARRAFATSVLAEPFERVNDRLAAFARNQALVRITVDLIFTHPYIVNERNRWTTPQLDDVVGSLRADSLLKAAVSRLGHRFLTVQEALLHGDLHTGSIMVSATDTRVIDAEFAAYGPIGFDLGLFIGNLLMAYLSQPGHESRPGERADQQRWILTQISEFWSEFRSQYQRLWSASRDGDAYPSVFFTSPGDQNAFALERERGFSELLADTLGFAGTEITRRIVGFAHNRDFESIENPDVRAQLERQSLQLARTLIIEARSFKTLDDVLTCVRTSR
jgi:5-methylthioribose kinase